MEYKLFRFAPFDRSARVAWCLEELGLPYEIVTVDGNRLEHKSPEYMDSVHPMGAVPALFEGKTKLFESIAICQYLADKYLDRGLAPQLTAPERADYTKWLGFMASTLDSLVTARMYMRNAHAETPTAATQKQFDKLGAELDLALSTLNSALGDRPFFVGDSFSVADIVLASHVRYRAHFQSVDPYANLKRHMNEMWERKAVREGGFFDIPENFLK